MEESEESKENVEIKNVETLTNIIHVENDNNYSKCQKFCCEFFGAFFLLFIGGGIGVFTRGQIVPVVLANGFVITSLIYIFGRISGAHFNPSVSIPMFLRGKITSDELLYYTVAQFSGGFAGTFYIALCNKGNFDRLSSTQIGNYLIKYDDENQQFIDTWSYMSAFFCELILTFGLVMVALGSTVKRNNFNNLTGIIMGLTLIMLIFVGFNLSGASMNPVRSIPPAILEAVFGGQTKAIKQVWIYILGPILGGLLATYISLFFV